MSQEKMQLHSGRLCEKCPDKKSVLPPRKKAKYTGQSKRNQQRKARAIKSKKLSSILQDTPSIRTYFCKANSDNRPKRNCKSTFSTKNNVTRAIKQKLQEKKKRQRQVPARSTKGHKQKSGGAVQIRTRRLSRTSRSSEKAKVKREESKLQRMPKKSHLVSTVRTRVEFLRKRMRSCIRCSLGLSNLMRDTHTILMSMLSNTFETRDGLCTVSHFQAASILKSRPGWRTLQHVKKFLLSGELPQHSRGGKRTGRSLLDDESFRSKASLWVKEQIALHTQRRLRAIRKKGKSKFVSQVELPMKEKTTANVTSATFQQYIEGIPL